MNKASAALATAFLCIAGLACSSVADRFTGGDKIDKAADLWSDVPRMDGTTPSDIDLPWTAKLLMRTALNNLRRFSGENEDKTPVQGDWTVFTTTGTPTDVSNFYTGQRMLSFGNWEQKEKTCISGKDKGYDNGLMCVFNKTENNKQMLLAILAAADDTTKQTNIFYLRLEKPVDQVQQKK